MYSMFSAKAKTKFRCKSTKTAKFLYEATIKTISIKSNLCMGYFCRWAHVQVIVDTYMYHFLLFSGFIFVFIPFTCLFFYVLFSFYFISFPFHFLSFLFFSFLFFSFPFISFPLLFFSIFLSFPFLFCYFLFCSFLLLFSVLYFRFFFLVFSSLLFVCHLTIFSLLTCLNTMFSSTHDGFAQAIIIISTIMHVSVNRCHSSN